MCKKSQPCVHFNWKTESFIMGCFHFFETTQACLPHFYLRFIFMMRFTLKISRSGENCCLRIAFFCRDNRLDELTLFAFVTKYNFISFCCLVCQCKQSMRLKNEVYYCAHLLRNYFPKVSRLLTSESSRNQKVEKIIMSGSSST